MQTGSTGANREYGCKWGVRMQVGCTGANRIKETHLLIKIKFLKNLCSGNAHICIFNHGHWSGIEGCSIDKVNTDR